MKEVAAYISINPEIRFGKPCIKGTRIAVADILQWLASGMTQEDILTDYPLFTKEHILAALAFAFLVVNFIFFENFFNADSFSGNLLTVEAYLLLIYCMLYYLAELNDDSNLFDGPHFWVVTGLAIYLVTNFFVFLFYTPMLSVDARLAVSIWNVHNIAFIIFCFFIAKAFYGTVRYKYSV